MRTFRVLKYALHLDRETLLPSGKALAVAFQNGRLHVWVEVLEDARGERAYAVVPTGEGQTTDYVHVGTAVSDHLVWHVYAEPVA